MKSAKIIKKEHIKMSVNNWEIAPYQRVGRLTFGIGQDEVHHILGKESLIDFDQDETILYYRENALQLVFDDQGLSNVSFYPYIANIFIEDKLLDWNKTKPLFKWILKNDPYVMEDVGIFVSFKFGITFMNFNHHENHDKSMSVFRKGLWTEDDPLLRPIE